jgi:hypothetical protein
MAASQALSHVSLTSLPKIAEGKVRDLYAGEHPLISMPSSL